MESIILLKIYVVVRFVFYSHEGCDTIKKRKSLYVYKVISSICGKKRAILKKRREKCDIDMHRKAI